MKIRLEGKIDEFDTTKKDGCGDSQVWRE